MDDTTTLERPLHTDAAFALPRAHRWVTVAVVDPAILFNAQRDD